jgi:hypothetical protein
MNIVKELPDIKLGAVDEKRSLNVFLNYVAVLLPVDQTCVFKEKKS